MSDEPELSVGLPKGTHALQILVTENGDISITGEVIHDALRALGMLALAHEAICQFHRQKRAEADRQKAAGIVAASSEQLRRLEGNGRG